MKLSEINAASLAKVRDKELLNLHRRLHQLWALMEKGAKYNREQLVNAHVFVVREMGRRGMEHNQVDGLDRESRRFEAAEGVILIRDFVQLVGSTAEGKADAGDVDILLRWPAEQRQKDWEVAILKALGLKDAEKPVEFIYAPTGPHGAAKPLYHLALVPAQRETEAVKWIPLKTRGGYGQFEFFEFDPLWETWAKGYIDRGIVVEMKYDGWRCIATREDDKVRLESEDAKTNFAHRLLELVEALKSLDCTDFVLDGELCLYHPNGTKIPRKDMASYLTAKQPAGEFIARYYVFDCVRKDGEWLFDKPWYERRAALEKVLGEPPDVIVPVPFALVKTKAGLREAIERFRKKPYSEGAMLKVYDSTYPRDGKTAEWAKLKNLKEVHVKVVDVERNAAGAYIYTCALRNGYIIGRTYATSLKAKKGDVLSVAVAEIKYDEKTGRLTWDNPIVRNIHNGPADTVQRAKEIAKAGRTYWAAKEGVEEGSLDHLEAGMSGIFTIQRHTIGKKDHYDVRLLVQKPKPWRQLVGFTLATGKTYERGDLLLHPQKGKKILVPEIKPYQPLAWLDVEGVMEPGSVGASKYEPGKFELIEHRQKWWAGVQEPHFKEFLFAGKHIKGRWILTYVPRQQGWEKAGSTKRVWMFYRPEDQKFRYEPLNLLAKRLGLANAKDEGGSPGDVKET